MDNVKASSKQTVHLSIKMAQICQLNKCFDCKSISNAQDAEIHTDPPDNKWVN